MKKVFAVLAMLTVAGIAQANYWNVNWKIYEAYAPTDTDGDYSPAVLDDYNVTWTLLYGSSVAVDPATGKLVDGSYTFTADMDSVRDGGLHWDYGSTHATYDETLYTTTGTTYTGNTGETDVQKVYQHIFIENKTNPKDAWYWLSDGTDVQPSSVTTGQVWDLGKSVALGPASVADANTAWVPVGVPEPATMSLLGLGALAMVLRRKIRK